MSTDTTTVWYRNVTHGSLHEVEKGTALEKRLRREQREVYEDDSDEPTFEPAYERVSAADLKKAQESPEKVPGFPTVYAEKKAEADATKKRQAARDELLDATLTKNAETPAS